MLLNVMSGGEYIRTETAVVASMTARYLTVDEMRADKTALTQYIIAGLPDNERILLAIAAAVSKQT